MSLACPPAKCGHCRASEMGALLGNNTKSLLTGESTDLLQTQLLQNLGMILHRENARAVVKRMFPAIGGIHALLNSASPLQASNTEADPSYGMG